MIEGLPSGVTPRFSSTWDKGFDILFADNQDNSKLPEQSADYTITLTYYTKLTSQATGDRKNKVTLEANDSNKSAEDNKYITDVDFEKSGWQDQTNKTIKWQIVLDKNKAGFGDTPVTIDDYLSDNQEYVEGSAVLKKGTDQWNANTLVSDSIAVEDKGTADGNHHYLFTLGVLNDASSVYVLTYDTVPTDEAIAGVGGKDQPTSIEAKNKAIVNYKGTSKEVTANSVWVNGEKLKKEIVTWPDKNNDYAVKFRITVNPNYLKLSPDSTATSLQTMTIKDLPSGTLDVDIDSIKVMQYASSTDTAGTDISNQASYTKAAGLTVNVPDTYKYVIEYTCHVVGNPDTDVAYFNKATAVVGSLSYESDVSKNVHIQKQSSSSGGSGYFLDMEISKYNSAALKTKVEGAEFTLYKDEVSDANKLQTGITDANGNVHFGQRNTSAVYNLTPGVKYIIVETKAPDGYIADPTPFIFQISCTTS